MGKKKDRYLAQLASASDHEFRQHVDQITSAYEREKSREQVKAHEASEYSGMSSAEFNDVIDDIPDDGQTRIAGLGVHLTLDEAMSAERKRRADGE